MEFLGFLIVVGLAIFFLKAFDSVAGRGPKQVSDGINRSKPAQKQQQLEAQRVPCPHCAEFILPAAKICPFCKSALKADQK
ncbi:hypothetical protein [Arhodomonas aquaeolei]|uniref:hypothetical protein n=1 Tax=Arhodomonas aquaeolei TaxID=2369 RepID=UPI0012EC293C|nr:hypothetical protein [Arhodomonas aquaeolei]